MPSLKELTEYLDHYLRVAEVDDSPEALNGLQVANAGQVTRLAVAVDACQATVDQAAKCGADFMVVHHGLFWGGLQPLTGRHGRRVRSLIEHGIALYGAHLPLDVHPEIGNNAVLARTLGVEDWEWFGDYRGQAIGVAGRLAMDRGTLVAKIQDALGTTARLIATGPEVVQRVGVVTGAAGDMIAQARDAGCDTFITGEGPHHSYFDAEEWGLNVIYAGHYATETVGVKTLGEHLALRFGLPWEFLDHPTGL